MNYKRIFSTFLIMATAITSTVPTYGKTKLNTPTIYAKYDRANSIVSVNWKYNDSDAYGINIYRSEDNQSFDFIGSSMDESFEDYEHLNSGAIYYYRGRSFSNPYVDNESTIFSDFSNTVAVKITLDAPSITSIKPSAAKAITLEWQMASSDDYTGFNIYRSIDANGPYTLVKSVTADTNSYEDTSLKIGQKYYYKVSAINKVDSKTYIGDYSTTVSATATIAAPEIKTATSPKKKQNKITWKKQNSVNGYIVYYSTKSNGKYKKLKTLSSNKTSYTHKKLKNSKAYYYKVYSYVKISNSKLLSVEPSAYRKYCNYYSFKKEPYEERYIRLFGSLSAPRYKTAKIAKKHMKTITIKVWDKKGKKYYKRKFYLTVNKALAPSIKKMFNEILKAKQRIPINSIGCYSPRPNNISEHCFGCAIDINPTENYMIDGKKILAGSFWNPKKSKYSIPLKCKFVTIMEKYGFTRGFWGDRKDYMHFSYFGT